MYNYFGPRCLNYKKKLWKNLIYKNTKNIFRKEAFVGGGASGGMCVYSCTFVIEIW